MNRHSVSRKRTVVLAVVTGLCACVSQAHGAPDHLTLDALLKIEGFGEAKSDPRGDWFVYEKIRPYDEIGDYSFRTYAFTKSGHQLWRYNLRKGGAPELLPGLDPSPSSYMLEFSSKGRFLAMLQYRYGRLRIAAYDMDREREVVFDRTPAFSKAGEHNAVWLSEEELLFAALPETQSPALTSIRVSTGRALSKAWEHAWRGDIATASEIRTIPKTGSGAQEEGALILANARTGKSRIVLEGLHADLRPSPDRRYVASFAVSKPQIDAQGSLSHDQRRYRLQILEPSTGRRRPLAQGLEFAPYTIAWAPDSRRVAAFGWPQGGNARHGRFYVVDVETGAVVRYDHYGLELASERERGWLQRPERTVFLGDALAVFARTIEEGEDPSPRFSVQDYLPIGLSRADWHAISADGSSQLLTEGLQGVSPVPIHAGEDHFTVVADDGVYRITGDGGRVRLSPEIKGRFRFVPFGTFATNRGVIRPEFPEEAVFSVSDGAHRTLVVLDLRDDHEGASLAFNAPGLTSSPLASSLRSDAMLFRSEYGPVSGLDVLESVDSDNRQRRRTIAEINTHLDMIDFGTSRKVSYEVADPEGKAPSQIIESCVLLPPGFSDAKPAPLIVEVYPNSMPRCGAEDPKSATSPSPFSSYLWPAKGYAYARLSTPRELIRTADGPIAGIDEVIEAGVEALIREGIADPERIAVFGFSQGGVSALYAAAHTDRFIAVIAANSWADFVSHYFGSAGVYSYVNGEYLGMYGGMYEPEKGGDFSIGRAPAEYPEVYYRSSPVFLASEIDVPVLLIHSDMDSFPMGQFDEMYGALLRAGKDGRYVRYWGEGHGPSSPANIRDMWDRIDAFLRDHGAPPEND